MNTITATPGVNSSRVSAPLSFKVSNQLRVNADKTLKLADTYIIAQGRPPLNPPLASNASFQTVVQGGRPPYTFSSSNKGAAVVDANGKVVAAGIGSASITVTDSNTPRNTASYEIKFTGTARLVKQGITIDWSANASDRNRPEFHALTRDEMASFWNQYKDEDRSRSVPAILGWTSDSNYWSADNILGIPSSWAVNFSAVTPDFGGISTSGAARLPTITKVSW